MQGVNIVGFAGSFSSVFAAFSPKIAEHAQQQQQNPKSPMFTVAPCAAACHSAGC
jgi:hypothetical protein